MQNWRIICLCAAYLLLIKIGKGCFIKILQCNVNIFKEFNFFVYLHKFIVDYRHLRTTICGLVVFYCFKKQQAKKSITAKHCCAMNHTFDFNNAKIFCKHTFKLEPNFLT